MFFWLFVAFSSSFLCFDATNTNCLDYSIIPDQTFSNATEMIQYMFDNLYSYDEFVILVISNFDTELEISIESLSFLDIYVYFQGLSLYFSPEFIEDWNAQHSHQISSKMTLVASTLNPDIYGAEFEDIDLRFGNSNTVRDHIISLTANTLRFYNCPMNRSNCHEVNFDLSCDYLLIENEFFPFLHSILYYSIDITQREVDHDYLNQCNKNYIQSNNSFITDHVIEVTEMQMTGIENTIRIEWGVNLLNSSHIINSWFSANNIINLNLDGYIFRVTFLFYTVVSISLDFNSVFYIDSQVLTAADDHYILSIEAFDSAICLINCDKLDIKSLTILNCTIYNYGNCFFNDVNILEACDIYSKRNIYGNASFIVNGVCNIFSDRPLITLYVEQLTIYDGNLTFSPIQNIQMPFTLNMNTHTIDFVINLVQNGFYINKSASSIDARINCMVNYLASGFGQDATVDFPITVIKSVQVGPTLLRLRHLILQTKMTCFEFLFDFYGSYEMQSNFILIDKITAETQEICCQYRFDKTIIDFELYYFDYFNSKMYENTPFFCIPMEYSDYYLYFTDFNKELYPNYLIENPDLFYITNSREFDKLCSYVVFHSFPTREELNVCYYDWLAVDCDFNAISIGTGLYSIPWKNYIGYNSQSLKLHFARDRFLLNGLSVQNSKNRNMKEDAIQQDGNYLSFDDVNDFFSNLTISSNTRSKTYLNLSLYQCSQVRTLSLHNTDLYITLYSTGDEIINTSIVNFGSVEQIRLSSSSLNSLTFPNIKTLSIDISNLENLQESYNFANTTITSLIVNSLHLFNIIDVYKDVWNYSTSYSDQYYTVDIFKYLAGNSISLMLEYEPLDLSGFILFGEHDYYYIQFHEVPTNLQVPIFVYSKSNIYFVIVGESFGSSFLLNEVYPSLNIATDSDTIPVQFSINNTVTDDEKSILLSISTVEEVTKSEFDNSFMKNYIINNTINITRDKNFTISLSERSIVNITSNVELYGGLIHSNDRDRLIIDNVVVYQTAIDSSSIENATIASTMIINAGSIIRVKESKFSNTEIVFYFDMSTSEAAVILSTFNLPSSIKIYHTSSSSQTTGYLNLESHPFLCIDDEQRREIGINSSLDISSIDINIETPSFFYGNKEFDVLVEIDYYRSMRCLILNRPEKKDITTHSLVIIIIESVIFIIVILAIYFKCFGIPKSNVFIVDNV